MLLVFIHICCHLQQSFLASAWGFITGCLGSLVLHRNCDIVSAENRLHLTVTGMWNATGSVLWGAFWATRAGAWDQPRPSRYLLH